MAVLPSWSAIVTVMDMLLLLVVVLVLMLVVLWRMYVCNVWVSGA